MPRGICLGLLGPNGAGKSTTMRLLTGQAIADGGDVEVLGFSLPGESKQARAQLGLVPQLDNLDVTLTVEQNLLVFTHLYRIGRGERQAAIERALEMARLVDRRDSRVDKLSGGMRRRLLIARALVHRPRLVLLDEPTVGLDPQVRQELWALIDALRSEGTSILMSTHYIEEAQRLADTVTIMSQGKAVAEGRPSELVVEHAGREVREQRRTQCQVGGAGQLARVPRDGDAVDGDRLEVARDDRLGRRRARIGGVRLRAVARRCWRGLLPPGLRGREREDRHVRGARRGATGGGRGGSGCRLGVIGVGDDAVAEQQRCPSHDDHRKAEPAGAHASIVAAVSCKARPG